MGRARTKGIAQIKMDQAYGGAEPRLTSGGEAARETQMNFRAKPVLLSYSFKPIQTVTGSTPRLRMRPHGFSGNRTLFRHNK